MSKPDFLVHETNDTVGVVVVKGVQADQLLTGWLMETDETLSIKALDPIPLGHKISLGEIASGDTIVKYNHDIGKAIAGIGKGHHAHTHNVKTKRW